MEIHDSKLATHNRTSINRLSQVMYSGHSCDERRLFWCVCDCIVFCFHLMPCTAPFNTNTDELMNLYLVPFRVFFTANLNGNKLQLLCVYIKGALRGVGQFTYPPPIHILYLFFQKNADFFIFSFNNLEIYCGMENAFSIDLMKSHMFVVWRGHGHCISIHMKFNSKITFILLGEMQWYHLE